MAAHAAVLEVDLHMPYANSLKAKRAVLRPIVEGLRQRFHVAVAEVDHHDLWQRSEVAVAAVSASPSQVTDILDTCERFVWAQPGIEVLECRRRWVEDG